MHGLEGLFFSARRELLHDQGIITKFNRLEASGRGWVVGLFHKMFRCRVNADLGVTLARRTPARR